MKRRILAPVAAVLTSIGALLVLLALLGSPDLAAAPAALTVTAVEPSSIPNDRDASIVITGTGFTAALSGTQVITPPTVLLNTTELADVGWVASTTLTSTVPAGFPVGVYTVTVETPDGADGSLPDALTVRYPAPELEAVGPLSGTYGQTMALTVTGTHFVPTPTVSLGRVPCPEVGVVSSKTLTVTVPGDLLPGIHDLTVRNPGPDRPQDVLPGAFTLYSPQPAVTDVEPLEGPNDLDIAVVITGTGFAPTPTARLEGTTLNDVAWVSMTQLTARVPWGMDPGTYGLTVTNPAPGAFDAALADAFTVTEGIGVWNPGKLYGGAVSDVLINPDDPDTIYAETQEVGLFRSGDGGASWSFIYAPSAQNTVIDPSHPDRIYLTGDPHHAWQFLWRSDDGGTHWIPLTTTFPVTETSGRRCYASDRLKTYVVSQTHTLYASACGTEDQFRGVIRSTDRGESWEPAIGGLTDTQVTDLAIHPTEALTMVAGTASGNVFISHNGGMTWTFASQPVSYVRELDVNPFGEHEVWIAAGTGFGGAPGVLKSTDAGLTEWTSVAPPGDVGYLDDFFTFAPRAWGQTYSETVFVACGHKTTDGGESWSSFGPESDWIYDYVYDFEPHPTQTRTLYAGVHDEGVYKTTDGGATWHVVNEGLTGLVPNELHSVPDHPDTVYAFDEFQQRMYKATQGGAVWQTLPITGVQGILVDPFTPTRIYAGVTRGVYISEDGGQTWPQFVHIDPPPDYEGDWYWANVLRAHPDNPGELLAAVSPNDGSASWTSTIIYRSTDWGQTWARGEMLPKGVRDIAYDPISPTIVYATTGDNALDPDLQGPVLKSTDSGQTWKSLDIQGVIGVEVEPGTHRVYIPNGPPCVDSVLCFSDDYGKTWHPTGEEHPAYITDFTFGSGDPPVIYAHSDGGLLKSEDRGKTWSKAAGTLERVPIYALTTAQAEERDILYAATTGGYVEDAGAQALRPAATADTLANPGVYRYTTRRARQLYLPLVLKAPTIQ